jgi:putative tryptophan/tyrosine transport system substrate-binding protein
MTDMRRREFIAVLGSMAIAWPGVTRAQQPVKKIGFLSISSPGPHAPFVAAFNEGLKEAGFVEGQNLAIKYSWAEGRFDRLPALAADLVHDKVDVIAAMSGDVSIRAAIGASSCRQSRMYRDTKLASPRRPRHETEYRPKH